MTIAPCPVLEASEIRVGDILLFRGPDTMSEISRFVDVANYDHAALVVETPEQMHVGVVDLGIRGAGRYALRDYETRPCEVRVRRHRIGGGEELVARRALEHNGEVMDYSFTRLVSIVMVCLTRSAENLASLEPAMARTFAYSITSLFQLAADRRQMDRDESGTGVCVDTILWPHDTFGSDAVDAPYYGLSIEQEPTGGLLAWVASAMQFEDFLMTQVRARRPRPGSLDLPEERGLHAEIAALYRSLHFSSPAPTVPNEQELRCSIVDAGMRLARELAIETGRNPAPLGGVDNCGAGMTSKVETSLLSVMAMWLLDSFLTNGRITTPRDLETTKSLYDVGVLDLASVPWSKANRS